MIMERTFMQVIAVLADMEESMVEVTFENISYKGHFQMGCPFDGIHILGPPERPFGRYIGMICSSKVAKKVLETYSHIGMHLEHKTLIVLKQYHGLSTMGAKLTFSISNCPGIFNFVPDYNWNSNASYTLFHQHRAGVWWTLSPKFYSRGFNQYYSSTLGPTVHLNLRNLSCWTLNYFMLSQMNEALRGDYHMYIKLHLHLSSPDRTSPLVVSINFMNTNPNIQDLYECFGTGLRALPDNRNDEPYTYTSSQWDTFSMRVYNVKIRINMPCLIFGANVYLKLERLGYPENTCFKEIGGYMYDKKSPVVPQGVCGDFPLHLDKWNRRYLSLTTPFPHPRCCYYNFVVENNNCFSTLSVVRTVVFSTQADYLIQIWHMPTERRVNLTWQGICTYNYPFTRRSYISTCMDMAVDAKAFCNMKVMYHASLISEVVISQTQALQVESVRNMKRLCLPNGCYTVPTRTTTMSWIDAEKLCKNQNSSLAGINTEEEWKLITRNSLIHKHGGNITLLPVTGVQMFYIGYRTRVSEKGVQMFYIGYRTRVSEKGVQMFYIEYRTTVSEKGVQMFWVSYQGK